MQDRTCDEEVPLQDGDWNSGIQPQPRPLHLREVRVGVHVRNDAFTHANVLAIDEAGEDGDGDRAPKAFPIHDASRLGFLIFTHSRVVRSQRSFLCKFKKALLWWRSTLAAHGCSSAPRGRRETVIEVDIEGEDAGEALAAHRTL